MTIKPDLGITIPDDLGTVHFVGIGGSGMSGIARLFLGAGHTVTGSDVRDSANVQALRDLGATVHIGHDAANVGDADTLVVTGALWQDNPEYQLALERGLPVLHRSQALAWLVSGQRLIAVAGAHGKTTSTGMIVTGLLGLGEDPSFVNGGVIDTLGVSSARGDGELFVVEADESDGSFLLYDTAVALITNVDPDHLDHYGSLEAFQQAFVDLRLRGERDRRHLLRRPRRRARERSPDAAATSSPSARPPTPTCASSTSITDGPVAFTLSWKGEEYRARLRIPGVHNAINAAGAFAVLVSVGFDPAASLAAISEFGGTERRFQLHGTVARCERLRRLRPPPDRGGRRALRRAHRRRRRPHHRRAPAAPVQPHPAVRPGVRRRARAVRRRDRRARRLRRSGGPGARRDRRPRQRAVRRYLARRLRARLAGGGRPHGRDRPRRATS